MLNHLKTKEETIYRGPRTYRHSGLECVEKIERKYKQEQRVLADTWKKDGTSFLEKLQQARHGIETNRKKRVDSIEQLEGNAASRQLMYRQATTSLRALHGRLMGGKLMESDNK